MRFTREKAARRERPIERKSLIESGSERIIPRNDILRKSRCVREENKFPSDRAAHNTTARDNVFNALAFASESAPTSHGGGGGGSGMRFLIVPRRIRN